jgi:hypothetical protein
VCTPSTQALAVQHLAVFHSRTPSKDGKSAADADPSGRALFAVFEPRRDPAVTAGTETAGDASAPDCVAPRTSGEATSAATSQAGSRRLERRGTRGRALFAVLEP